MILHIDSIQKRIKDRILLHDIFLQCAPGDMIAIFGRNGCGKTTLFHIILGMIPAEQAFVKLGDRVLKTAEKPARIGYLPQGHFLPGQLRVQRILALYLKGKNYETALKHPKIAAVLDLRPQELSTGTRRWLELFISLQQEKPFLLLDEPFNGLEPLLIEEAKAMLLEAAKTKGIIMTDHRYLELFDIANRKMVLREGVLLEIQEMDDLIDLQYLPGKFDY